MAASELIEKIVLSDNSSDLLLYAPAQIYHLLVLSCITTMKILNSSFSKYLDIEAGKKSFNKAIPSLRRLSVANNDGPGRATEILTKLWCGLGSSSLAHSEPVLRIQSRGSASVLHDEVWRFRETYFGQPNAYPLSGSGNDADNLSAAAANAAGFDDMSWAWGFDFDSGRLNGGNFGQEQPLFTTSSTAAEPRWEA